MNTEMKVKEIRAQAESLYESGSFNCCESVVSAVLEGLDMDYPNTVVRMATGFGGGMGADLVCGALSGGVLSIGMACGRFEPKDPQGPHCKNLAKELVEHFQNKEGHLDCGVLSKDYEHGTPEHKGFCKQFVGEATQKALEIIAREKNIAIRG